MMLKYHNNQLYADDIALADIAKQFNTPCYIYSRSTIEQHWLTLEATIAKQKHLICYAVKANSNIAVLNILAKLGSGFDIVSLGELERVIKAGGDTNKIVFSGVGKKAQEMQRALEVGIKCFNVESLDELERLNEVAGRLGKVAPVALRINPDIDPKTHAYIATGLKENKFGIAFDQAIAGYQHAASMAHINVIGIGCHIGSQITSMKPFEDALERLTELIQHIEALGIVLHHIDLGGGLGIRYRDETPPTIQEYGENLYKKFTGTNYEIILEPGRGIVGNAGILLTQVEFLKYTAHKNFAIVDAAMNDLLRPSLYNAEHAIMPVHKPESSSNNKQYDIVGSICETADFLAKKRHLTLQQGDILAICSTGAYSFTMSSTYNSRPQACELMIDRKAIYEIKRRQTIAELMAGESILPDRKHSPKN